MPDQRQHGISWTDETWNPIRGCSRVSEGCRNCYAERMAATRLAAPGQAYHGLAEMTPAGPRWTGRVALVPELLDRPRRWARSRLIFVNSMSDLFHEALPDEAIARVWEAMLAAPQHRYQVLTKRATRLVAWAARYPSLIARGAPTIWLGVSAEDQGTWDARVGALLSVPYSGVLWVSAEPLLGEIDVMAHVRSPRDDRWNPGRTVDWIVVGGESGPGARPFDCLWARAILAACRVTRTPCFMKQLGTAPLIGRFTSGAFVPDYELHLKAKKGSDMAEWPTDLRVRAWPRAFADRGFTPELELG